MGACLGDPDGGSIRYQGGQKVKILTGVDQPRRYSCKTNVDREERQAPDEPGKRDA